MRDSLVHPRRRGWSRTPSKTPRYPRPTAAAVNARPHTSRVTAYARHSTRRRGGHSPSSHAPPERPGEGGLERRNEGVAYVRGEPGAHAGPLQSRRPSGVDTTSVCRDPRDARHARGRRPRAHHVRSRRPARSGRKSSEAPEPDHEHDNVRRLCRRVATGPRDRARGHDQDNKREKTTERHGMDPEGAGRTPSGRRSTGRETPSDGHHRADRPRHHARDPHGLRRAPARPTRGDGRHE